MPGTATGGLSTAPKRRRSWRTRPTFAAVTAVVAFLISLFNVYRAEGQLDVVEIVAAEQTSQAEPRMIDVAFVNTSKRTVAITSATIEWEGYTAGRVNRFVPGLGSLDPRPLAARLADAARPPLALASGEAFTGSVVWTDYTDGTSAPGITEAVDRYLSADRTGGQEPDGKLEVKLAVSPGLDETQDVRLTIGDDQLEELAGPPMGDWPATLVLEPSSGEVNGIAVYGRTLTMGTVEIWGERPDPMAKVTRPLLAGRRTVFPIADLPPGRYLWTLTAGEGGPVSGGELETPCPDPGSREVEPRRCEPADG